MVFGRRQNVHAVFLLLLALLSVLAAFVSAEPTSPSLEGPRGAGTAGGDAAAFDAVYGRAVALVESEGETEAALDAVADALVLSPDSAESRCRALCNLWSRLYREALGAAAGRDGRSAESRLAQAGRMLDKALSIDAGNVAALHNLGITREAEGQSSAAVGLYTRVLALEPGHGDALLNLGNWRLGNGLYAEAAELYARAASSESATETARASAMFNLGQALKMMGRVEEAAVRLEEARLLQGGSLEVELSLLTARRTICDWSRSEDDMGSLLDLTLALEQQLGLAVEVTKRSSAVPRAGTAHATLFLPYDSTLLDVPAGFPRLVAEAMPKRLVSPAPRTKGEYAALANTAATSGLRVAYLSFDMRDHAMGHLGLGVFNGHKVNGGARVQHHCYHYGPDAIPSFDGQVTLTTQIALACQARFSRWHQEPGDAIAEHMRNNQMHIVVDLMGHTTSARYDILPHKAAPILVNYLGYPGTLGTREADFVVVDRFVAPPEQASQLSEGKAFVPFVYQAKEFAGTRASWCASRGGPPIQRAGSLSRQACLRVRRLQHFLPSSLGVAVLAQFNIADKIEPHVFTVWMQVLVRYPQSVVWMMETKSTEAKTRLWREAAARGVHPRRIIFTRHLSRDNHTARYELVDLFLDAFVYGAHSTATDSLWAAVPVLTRSGDAFQGRVAAGLSSMTGTHVMNTASSRDYVDLAARLLLRGHIRQAVQHKLDSARPWSPAFSPDVLARDLESLYRSMWELERASARTRNAKALGALSADSQWMTDTNATATRRARLGITGRLLHRRDSTMSVRRWNIVPAMRARLAQLPSCLRDYSLTPCPKATHLSITEQRWKHGAQGVSVAMQSEFKRGPGGLHAQELIIAGDEVAAAHVVNVGLASKVQTAFLLHVSAILTHLAGDHVRGFMQYGLAARLLQEGSAADALLPPGSDAAEMLVQWQSTQQNIAVAGIQQISSRVDTPLEKPDDTQQLADLHELMGDENSRLLALVKRWHRHDWRTSGRFVHKQQPNGTASKPSLAIYCNEYNKTWWPGWGPWSLNTTGMGGSEEAVVHMVRELVKLDYFSSVTVYAEPSTKHTGLHADGGWWYPHAAYNPHRPADVFVSWRYHISTAVAFASQQRYVWLQDLVDLAQQFTQGYSPSITGAFVLSQFHARDMPAWMKPKTHIMPNAVDMAHVVDGENRADVVVYASQPGRGLLEVLLVWPQIRQAIPSATLVVYYGFTDSVVAHLKATLGDFDAWFARMQQLLRQEGVQYVGLVDHKTLARGLANASFYLYPTSYPETGCIAVQKAMVAGAIPITSKNPNSVLPEIAGLWDLGPTAPPTAAHRVISADPDWMDRWARATIDALDRARRDDPSLAAHRKKMVAWARGELSWQAVAKKWVDRIDLDRQHLGAQMQQ